MLNCYRTLLLLSAQILARAQEIKLDNLDDGPGLLPFKLGHTRLITHYHTFLQYIELDKIEHEISLLKGQLQDFENKLTNDTFILYELQINYLANKTDKILDHLSSLEPSRTKRGLLDGLGSIIKSITGNLDYQDAIKYNDALKMLKINQNKLAVELNNRISLNNEWMSEHTNIISQIVDNQSKINSTLQLILDKNPYQDAQLIKYGKFAQLLAILSENTDDLLDELIRIENILAFTRTTTTHHSMLSLNVLRIMLDRLRAIYSREQVITLELRDYYNIIKSGSYFIGKQIVIVFRFPIVSSSTFDLYRLSLAPNKFHQILIPPFPLIATNRKEYVYIEAECPKFEGQHLCEESQHQKLRIQPDCIMQIILHQTLSSSCNFSTVHLSRAAMEQLDDRSYVISFPEPTKVQLHCGTEDYNLLNGSFLATIPIHCSLRTTEFTIANTDDIVQGQPLKIMKITYPDDIKITPKTHLNLNTIDLRALHNHQDKIMVQPPLQLASSTEALYHTTIPFYIVLLGAAALAAIVLSRRYGLWKRNPGKREQDPNEIKPDGNHRDETSEDPIYSKPSLPAIFSHKLRK